MKKFFIAMCVALIGLCASAQEKGNMAVGLNIGVAPCLESEASFTNFGIGAKFQYNVTDPIRVEADVNYWFKNNATSVFDISANIHYLFTVGSKVKVYPLVGVGYGNLHGFYGDGNGDDGGSLGRFLFNVGAGAEYPVTEKLAVGLEIKYQYMQHFSRLPISFGVTYKF